MTAVGTKRIVCAVALLWALGRATSLHAQADIGTWVRQSGAATPGVITMTVEACCSGGRRITFRMEGTEMVMTVESPFDGSDAPVLVDGKPSGETMAVKRLDDRHTTTVMKLNGKAFGTSKATLAADGSTITVENDVTSTDGGQQVGKTTETWVRK